MSSNPDPSKQTQEIILSRKPKKVNHFSLIFNNIAVNQTTFSKATRVILDSRLIFDDHLKSDLCKLIKQ